MKTIEKIASAENFSAVNVGSFATLGDYLLQMGPEVKIPGKVFCGAAVQATGSEFSFQSFAPGTETGFLHTHKNHEELYFFISGNNGTQPLVMLCVQYKGGTFTAEDAADGNILAEKVEW